MAFMLPPYDARALVDGALQLSELQLSEVPAWVFDRPNHASSLRVLAVWKNRLRALPPSLGALRSLETLNAFGNLIAELPASTLPPSLTSLILSQNQITSIASGAFAPLVRLRHLELCANLLTDSAFAGAAAELSTLAQLDFLDITSNRMHAIPHAAIQPDRLRELRASMNALGACPPALPRCAQLQRLVLVRCSLESVPEDVLALPQLELLDLARNGLSELPAVRGLGRLRELRVGRNNLSGLPASLVACLKLTPSVGPPEAPPGAETERPIGCSIRSSVAFTSTAAASPSEPSSEKPSAATAQHIAAPPLQPQM